MSTILEFFFPSTQTQAATLEIDKTVTNYMGMENSIPSYLTQLKSLITCWFLDCLPRWRRWLMKPNIWLTS